MEGYRPPVLRGVSSGGFTVCCDEYSEQYCITSCKLLKDYILNVLTTKQN